MHELAPRGYAPLLDSIGAVAKAYRPSLFTQDDDPKLLGAAAFARKYDNVDFEVEHSKREKIYLFNQLHKIIRQSAANGFVGLFVLDKHASLHLVEPRYWATDEGNFDLLHGWYWGGLVAQPLQVYVEQFIVDRLMPPKQAPPKSARGREALEDRLRQHMDKHPIPNSSKQTLVARFGGDLALSKRSIQISGLVWNTTSSGTFALARRTGSPAHSSGR